jgi:hypothetical protein
MKNVFLPMDAQGQPQHQEPQAAIDVDDRRRFSRHRFSTSLEISVVEPRGRYDTFDAMTFEISEGGLSAATPNILFVGERVRLNPVMGFHLQAVVKRKNGAMYGFEFVGLSDAQRDKIRKDCERLPPFSSMLNV